MIIGRPQTCKQSRGAAELLHVTNGCRLGQVSPNATQVLVERLDIPTSQSVQARQLQLQTPSLVLTTSITPIAGTGAGTRPRP